MRVRFQELDWRRTALGELVLRRRWDPATGKDVHEIKLDDEFLMSSLFTVSERELGLRGLAEPTHPALDVVVGGLGLGYTAHTVLEHPNVRSLVVVEALAEVIEWHERDLIPGGAALATDPRCRLVHGDFFDRVRSGSPWDPSGPSPEHADHDRRCHAVLVDIDHSPRHLLDPGHADFYEPAGLRRLAARLLPGGVFALWSNDPPDDEFTAALGKEFAHARADVIRFPNPLQNREATSTVYLATAPPA